MTSAATATELTPRPRLRGRLHQIGFFVACAAGGTLVGVADEPRRWLAAAFAVPAAVMLGSSALYHRVIWGVRARRWMRRLDHAGIYLLIAGTYTPVGLLNLHGTLQRTVLITVWSGAAAGVLTKLCWVQAPKWLSAALGIAIGWVGIAALPQVAESAGPAAVALLAAGGIAYTVGAVVYARRRPDPVPAVFGYHELFHALTLVALACQYTAVAFYVIRVG
jgi:hemolysin III